MRGHDLTNRIARLFALVGAIPTNPYVPGGTDVPVADGGTGSSSLAANNVLLGNGTSALQVVAPGTSGNVLTSNGTTWQSTAPASSSSLSSVKPTTDVNDMTVTGLTSKNAVRVAFALSHNSTSTKSYEVQCRVAAGTWRTVAAITAEAAGGPSSPSHVIGWVDILGFSSSAGKLAKITMLTDSGALDDSNAANPSMSGDTPTTSYLLRYASYAEAWSEVRVINATDSGTTIEGSATDERGQMWVLAS